MNTLESTEIQIGDKVEIEVRYQNQTFNFPSSVEFIIDNSILITKIVNDEQTIGFTGSIGISFICNHEGKLFLWDNVSVKLVRYDNEIYHKVDLSGPGKSYNRRQAYRVYVGDYMNLMVNTASGATTYEVLVKDISETGIGIVSKEEFDVNRTIRLNLKDGDIAIPLRGVIVRKEFIENLKANVYGCRFTEKTQKLGPYIMKKQSSKQKDVTHPLKNDSKKEKR